MTAQQESVDTRIPGIALAAGAIALLFAMAHHPTAGGGGDFATFARNVDRIAPINQAVHGSGIVLVAVLTWTVIALAMRRGLYRPLVMLGLVAWTIGAAGMTIAPAFNGFIITDIARRALSAPETSEMLRVALQPMSSAVRVIEIIGALGLSAAILLWSADLMRTEGAVRSAGVLGMAAGAALVIGLTSEIVRLNVAGFTIVVALWAAWFLAVGALMIRRKV